MPKKKKESGKKTAPLLKTMECPDCKKVQIFSLVNGLYRCPICGFTKQM